MKITSLVILLLVGFSFFSCSENTPTEPDTTLFDIQGENGFVGTLDGVDAFIALLVADDEAIVYVCNGNEEISDFFRGTINDATEISIANNNGAQISAKFEGSLFTGEVKLRNSSTFSFTAAPNTGTETGILQVFGDEAKQDSIEAGWIINAIGEERGSLRIRRINITPPPPSVIIIHDGTDKTIMVGAKIYPVFRFFLQRSSNGRFQIIAPNN